MNAPDEFYIGYTSHAPPRTAVWIRHSVVAAIVATASLAVVVVLQQQAFPSVLFDYGNPQTFTGFIREKPFPHAELDGGRNALLVAPGKRGADDLIRGLDGRRADFSGTRIQRNNDLMLELTRASIRVLPGGARQSEPEWANAGPVELRGEIVDSKCYLGVMNPGEGKVHRDCAARCISGGVPAAFIARDSDGRIKLLPMTGPAGASIGRRILSYVAEPVIVRGSLFRSSQRFRIEVAPENIRRAE